MADFSLFGNEWPPDRPDEACCGYDEIWPGQREARARAPACSQPHAQPPPPSQGLLYLPAPMPPPLLDQAVPRGDNPREIRNKAEKQRRDKLNQSIAELASMVPPVVAASRKIDKTGVLRLTAHYLRAHQYVFGDSIVQGPMSPAISPRTATALIDLLGGFLLTTTYKGIVVVASQSVQQYLGYSELDLLGQSVFNIVHPDDQVVFKNQMMPKSQLLGPNGELLVPDEPDGKKRIADMLSKDKRAFVIRFKKQTQRSEPPQYVTCHVEGSLRKSDRACRGYNRCCQMVRRARARAENPCSSGNDVVFIGIVRPSMESFITECGLEQFKMEYRTRHSIDGEIIQSEQRIALVTGYMTHEVHGVNAMNFMHRDDVRWVIIALKEMYQEHRIFGESCYRLLTKNGQFIYMKTRGCLEVSKDSRDVTSFVCTNTLVEEDEGKHLINLMKKKFTLTVSDVNDSMLLPIDDETVEDPADGQALPVEDPKSLEKVILHLVTNLPSPEPDDNANSSSLSPNRGTSPSLAIIPPRKEKILSAIEKIYTIIKVFRKEPTTMDEMELEAPKPQRPTVTTQDIPTFDPDATPSTSGGPPSDTTYANENYVECPLAPQRCYGAYGKKRKAEEVEAHVKPKVPARPHRSPPPPPPPLPIEPLGELITPPPPAYQDMDGMINQSVMDAIFVSNETYDHEVNSMVDQIMRELGTYQHQLSIPDNLGVPPQDFDAEEFETAIIKEGDDEPNIEAIEEDVIKNFHVGCTHLGHRQRPADVDEFDPNDPFGGMY